MSDSKDPDMTTKRLCSENKLSILDNPNLHLNPELTDFLTHCTNGNGEKLTPLEESFCRRGYSINVQSGRPFCDRDMKPVCTTNASFRQIIHSLKPLLEIVINSRPKYYKFKVLTIDQKLTKKYTDLSPNQRIHDELDIKLAEVNHEQPKIHNIRLKFKADGLYANLVKNYPKPPNYFNKKYTIRYEIDKLDCIVSIPTTDNVVFTVACTYFPIEYSLEGFARLFFILGQIKACLDFDSKAQNIVQDFSLWRFIHFDFNKDSVSFECDYLLHEVYGHVQIYTKKMHDKTTRLRVESREGLKTTIIEEMETLRFQKANQM